MQPICGRPLGMRFRKLNPDLLLVADSYFGIYEIDVISGQHIYTFYFYRLWPFLLLL